MPMGKALYRENTPASTRLAEAKNLAYRHKGTKDRPTLLTGGIHSNLYLSDIQKILVLFKRKGKRMLALIWKSN
jgi:hypothetical protein